MSGKKHLIAIAISSLLFGCDRSSKRLVGGYSVERFEQGQYYLVCDGCNTGSGGVFEGTIEEIGWSDQRILARVTRVYRGDTDGWYVLDLNTRQVRGPLSDSELLSSGQLLAIKCRKPSDLLKGK